MREIQEHLVRPRGDRNASWLVLQRGLAIVRRLMRGPATGQELIVAVRQAVGINAYGLSHSAAIHALKNDRSALATHLGIEVKFDRHLGCYQLISLGDVPWLDLPDEALAAVATIYTTFTAGNPEAERVRAFLDQIASLLPSERLAQLRRPALAILLRDLDEHPVIPRVMITVERAVTERRRLGFRYSAAMFGECLTSYHEVEPYAIVFRDGHYYLECFDLFSRSEGAGQTTHNQHRRFRLQGILDDEMLRILPERLPIGRRARKQYPIRYRLAPPAVHHGVSPHFADMQVERHADGWATITALTPDPWEAVRTLLHYGDSCVVLGGDEVLLEMQKIVAAMAKNYDLLAYEFMEGRSAPGHASAQ